MAAHTPGQWAWVGDCLLPVNPQPEVSAVHTILSPDGCFGYLGAANDAVMAEDAANRALIAAAPDLLEVCLLFARWANSCDDFRYPPGSLQQLVAAIAKATGGAS